jgi:hypothetical protein
MGTQLATAIIMATISALAFIAYRHPKGYAKMYWPIYCTVMAGLLLWFTFEMGYILGFSDSTIGFLTLNHGIALHDPEKHDVPFWAWFLPSLFLLYLQFLKTLPRILDLPVDDENVEKPKDKVIEKGSHDA